MNSPIMELVEKHDEWRSSTLNLLPSENILSRDVRRALASDLASRYSLEIDGYVHEFHVENAYRGTKYAEEIIETTEKFAEDTFRARYAEVRAISGHISAEIMLLSTLQRGDRFMAISAEDGGYDGYMPDYLPDMFSFEMHPIPFDGERMLPDYEGLEKAVRRIEPELIVLGASYFPFPYDLKRIRDFYDGYLAYDASHVLGLIASGAFQPDIAEYVDIMVGSTHKSLYGPQGGIVLVYDEDLVDRVRFNTTWRTLDNPHLNRIAALGQALYELRQDPDYGKRCIDNAKELAKELDKYGIPVRFAPHYTESHQVLIDVEKLNETWDMSPHEFSIILEKNDIIVDSVGRLGTAEISHRGMGREQMGRIAEFIKGALEGKDVGKEVLSFVSNFPFPGDW